MNERSMTTKRTFILFSLLSVPLLASHSFMGVILYKNLGGTPFQVTILTMIRPVVALLALYWSFAVAGRSDRLKSNLVWSGLMARLPFFLCPVVESPWLFIAIAGCYTLSCRGGIPAWMEVFRRNLSKEEHGRVFSSGSSWSYVEGIVLTLAIGAILDGQTDAWRWIFPVAAGIGLIGVYLQTRIPVSTAMIPSKKIKRIAFWKSIVAPWKDAWKLMRERRDFRRFQWGFMICGGAMMIIQPALPIFFVDILDISYTELGVVMSVCKGLGFAITSPLWGRRWQKGKVFSFSAAIFFIVAIYPLFLMVAPSYRFCLYLGFFVYGIAQAGSEMCWHLSGMLFTKDSDSARFTGVNVAMVGVRGVLIPPIGAWCCTVYGPLVVFGIASFASFVAAVLMIREARPSYVLVPVTHTAGSL